MSYNLNLVLGLSMTSLGMLAEGKSKTFIDEHKVPEPLINRLRDISLIAMYCLARNHFSRSFFRNSFDILTLGVSLSHIAQLTSFFNNDTT